MNREGCTLRSLTDLARAASAGPGDASALLSRLSAGLEESFDLGRVDVYRYAPELAGRPVFREALASAGPACAGGELVLPLFAADGCVGFVRAERDELPPPDQLEVLAAAAAFAATLLQRALEHDELERLSRLKSQFIALASHELRAPAAVIHGVAKTVAARADGLPPDRLRALHETLSQHTERLTRLLDDLLDLSRLDAKAIQIDTEPTPVRERLEEVVEAVAGDRAGEVSIEVADDLEPLLDPTAFERIVANLVTNALRHGKTPVSVKAVQSDRHFRLTVEDQGKGVSPDFVPRLFERFARDATAEAPKGSGLGLSIAQAYAQAHGGQLFYEDASPHGARFQLVLPVT